MMTTGNASSTNIKDKPRRNSLLDGIEEEQSAEFSQELLNLEFQDSDDEDDSISLGLSDAMVGDDELRGLQASAASVDRDQHAQEQDEEEVQEDFDEEAGSTSKRDKSLTEKIQKRTGRIKLITWGLLLLWSVVAILTSHFISRGEDCEEKREQFAWNAALLEQSVRDGIRDREHTLQILANQAASDQWPMHTMADFDSLANSVIGNTEIFDAIYLAPRVSPHQFAAWETYVKTTTGYDNITIPWIKRSDTTNFALPLWQMVPATDMSPNLINLNLLGLPGFSEKTVANALSSVDADKHLIWGMAPAELGLSNDKPAAFVMQPIQNPATSNIGAVAVAVLPWTTVVTDNLFPATNIKDQPVMVQVTTKVPQGMVAMRVQGTQATLYDENEIPPIPDTGCFTQVCFHLDEWIQVCIAPTDIDTDPEASTQHIVLTTLFCVVALALFCVYDCVLFRAQRELATAANQSLAVVSSLFPKDFQERLLDPEKSMRSVKKELPPEETHPEGDKTDNGASSNSLFGRQKRGLTRTKSSLTSFMYEQSEASEHNGGIDFLTKTKPIADLFPDTTIFFGDLVGFTAWASAREPTSVFRLLETIYYHFDELAKQRRVFKVETVGDCYVAVAGLPQPRKDHAMVMCRFANECLVTFNRLVKQLEVELGPDTGDLGLRIGLHSGQTTAGILRGDRARFQLFGDTVNVTSRMESTGKPGMIQLSQQTADILTAAGKGHWITPREEAVVAKGKGELATYWLQISFGGSQGTASFCSETEWTEAADGSGLGIQEVGGQLQRSLSQQMLQATETHIPSAERHTRLVEWNAELLMRLLKGIIAHRLDSRKKADDWEEICRLEESYKEREALVMEEVVEVIELPSFTQAGEIHPESVDLSPIVVQQVKSFVETISFMYRDNPFHNFEHASHVCMSVNKLLSRIIAPDIQLNGSGDINHELHDHTYGITSDPLTQFACVLCALIHDVDHTGLPNSVLVNEETPLAKAYNNRSVAEQNSIDLAWDALMGLQYTELRQAIYQTKEEFQRFRQLMVNAVLATDIMDKELKALRNSRWEKTFADKSQASDSDAGDNDVSRKATIVIEHIIQASDVSHTMQHWQIYRKWNHRLYEELYNAYREGRIDSDPTDNWYKGEIGFLDFYVIPLAKKLKECGVFGVSSDEYLSYAQQNREEWVKKGQAITAEMRQQMDTDKARKGKSYKSISLLTTNSDCSFSNLGNLSFSQSQDMPTDGPVNRRDVMRRGSTESTSSTHDHSSRRNLLTMTNSFSNKSLGSRRNMMVKDKGDSLRSLELGGSSHDLRPESPRKGILKDSRRGLKSKPP